MDAKSDVNQPRASVGLRRMILLYLFFNGLRRRHSSQKGTTKSPREPVNPRKVQTVCARQGGTSGGARLHTTSCPFVVYFIRLCLRFPRERLRVLGFLYCANLSPVECSEAVRCQACHLFEGVALRLRSYK